MAFLQRRGASARGSTATRSYESCNSQRGPCPGPRCGWWWLCGQTGTGEAAAVNVAPALGPLAVGVGVAGVWMAWGKGRAVWQSLGLPLPGAAGSVGVWMAGDQGGAIWQSVGLPLPGAARNVSAAPLLPLPLLQVYTDQPAAPVVYTDHATAAAAGVH